MEFPKFVPIEVARCYEEVVADWSSPGCPGAAATRLVSDVRMEKVYKSLSSKIHSEREWRLWFDLTAWGAVIDFDQIRADKSGMAATVSALVPLLKKVADALDDIESIERDVAAPEALVFLKTLLRSYSGAHYNNYVKPKLLPLFSQFSGDRYWPTPAALVRIMADEAQAFRPQIAVDIGASVASRESSDFASYIRYVDCQIALFNEIGDLSGFGKSLTIPHARMFDLAAVALGDTPTKYHICPVDSKFN